MEAGAGARGAAPSGARRGGRVPTAVLLHGNPTWGFLWREVAARARRLRAPARHAGPRRPRPLRQAARSRLPHARAPRALVGALLDALAPGPLLLVVHDWGGPIGLAALADRPGRLAGLVVTNTGVGPPRAGTRPTPLPPLREPPRRLRRRVPAARLPAERAPPRAGGPRLDRGRRRAGLPLAAPAARRPHGAARARADGAAPPGSPVDRAAAARARRRDRVRGPGRDRLGRARSGARARAARGGRGAPARGRDPRARRPLPAGGDPGSDRGRGARRRAAAGLV